MKTKIFFWGLTILNLALGRDVIEVSNDENRVKVVFSNGQLKTFELCELPNSSYTDPATDYRKLCEQRKSPIIGFYEPPNLEKYYSDQAETNNPLIMQDIAEQKAVVQKAYGKHALLHTEAKRRRKLLDVEEKKVEGEHEAIVNGNQADVAFLETVENRSLELKKESSELAAELERVKSKYESYKKIDPHSNDTKLMLKKMETIIIKQKASQSDLDDLLDKEKAAKVRVGTYAERLKEQSQQGKAHLAPFKKEYIQAWQIAGQAGDEADKAYLVQKKKESKLEGLKKDEIEHAKELFSKNKKVIVDEGDSESAKLLDPIYQAISELRKDVDFYSKVCASVLLRAYGSAEIYQSSIVYRSQVKFANSEVSTPFSAIFTEIKTNKEQMKSEATFDLSPIKPGERLVCNLPKSLGEGTVARIEKNTAIRIRSNSNTH